VPSSNTTQFRTGWLEASFDHPQLKIFAAVTGFLQSFSDAELLSAVTPGSKKQQKIIEPVAQGRKRNSAVLTQWHLPVH